MTKPNWYDDWEIITSADEFGSGWVKKTIKIPNSATVKEKIIYCEEDGLVHEVILDLESALYTLSEMDKPQA